MQPRPSPLQPAFVRNVLDVRGAGEGQAFLDSLPTVIDRCRERWGLAIEAPFAGLTYNWAAPATTSSGEAAVLKIGFAADPEVRSEMAALRLFDGNGAVRVLAAEPGDGAMLLERALPGTSLLTKDDDTATLAASRVMPRLWRPLPGGHPFPTVAAWSLGFARLRERHGGTSGPLPERWVARAEAIYAEFLAEGREQVLLHGDLHHGNILSSKRERWLAIDPKGVAGEREYEPGAFLRNPLDLTSRPDAGPVIRRRLDIFARELGLDRERMRQWAIGQAMLSAVWTLEGHGTVSAAAIETARLLDEEAGSARG